MRRVYVPWDREAQLRLAPEGAIQKFGLLSVRATILFEYHNGNWADT